MHPAERGAIRHEPNHPAAPEPLYHDRSSRKRPKRPLTPSHAVPRAKSERDSQWNPGSRTETEASIGQKNTGIRAPTEYFSTIAWTAARSGDAYHRLPREAKPIVPP